ncbi:MAG: hypothetical protein EOO65_00275 [Methanosarcinales archaeon]|nr:MAG: hypothetical protein EOO65_00275 [Methanosarcinales archaeon]
MEFARAVEENRSAVKAVAAAEKQAEGEVWRVQQLTHQLNEARVTLSVTNSKLANTLSIISTVCFV